MKRLFIASATISACLTVSAMAADLGVRPMPVKAAPAPIVFSWTGFYVGGNAGWIESENSMSNQAIPTPDATLGVIAGVSEGLAALSSGSVSAGHKSGFIGGAARRDKSVLAGARTSRAGPRARRSL